MKPKILSERANLFEPNVYIHVLVEISGNISLKDLVYAIKTAYTKNESTMSRIVLTESGTAYYEKMEQSGCKTFVSDKKWQDIVNENEKVPFALEKGELIRSFVIPSHENTMLLIMAHHLAGDGKSITYFVRNIFSIISGQAKSFTPLTVLTKEELLDNYSFPLKVRLFLKSNNRRWNKKNVFFSWDDYYAIHKSYWNKYQSHILFFTLSQDDTEKIHERAKSMGITINSYITTAFLAADSTKRRIGIPVSIRKDANQSMTNLTSGIQLRYKYNPSKSFASNAQAVHKKIYSCLNSPMQGFILPFIASLSPSLLDAVVLNSNDSYHDKLVSGLTKIMGYAGKNTRDLGITNLTRLDIPSQYGPYTINKCIFIPPAVSYSRNNLGVATINNCLTISYRIMDERQLLAESLFFNKGLQNLIK